MSRESILAELADNVLVLKLNRKPVNAFDETLFFELQTKVEAAAKNPDVRCIVLTSNLTKAFTAGLDLKSSNVGAEGVTDPGRRALSIKHTIDKLQAAVTCLELCRVPTIAAIHGLALGAAIDLATACDIRLASSETVFSVKEVDIGIAADIGTLQRLPKVIGNASKMRELVFTARNFGSQEAYEMGLLSRVVPGGLAEVQAEAIKLAKIIASKSPLAVTGSKMVLNFSRDHSVADGLEYVGVYNTAMLQSEELTKAMQAFATGKPAVWAPLAKL